ncbi:transposase, partial [Bifidobacterium breve]
KKKKEIQIEAVCLYLKGVPTVEIRKKFGIKGSATLGIWVKSIKRDGIYGIKDSHRKQTSYPYSFKLKVINWRLTHHASYPVAAPQIFSPCDLHPILQFTYQGI